MTAYYNDPATGPWLRELISEGHIAHGVVDERPIQAVEPSDLDGFTQCHFFAGVGVWSYALRQAGWPDDRPAWTGSCPCQPFSAAGKGAGFDDPRHLWPDWLRLLRQCRPGTCFGEQVASAGQWLDLVQSDWEALSYAFAAIDLPAAGFSSAHIRQRLFWVADTDNTQWWAELATRDVVERVQAGWIEGANDPGARGEIRGLAFPHGAGQCSIAVLPVQDAEYNPEPCSRAGGLGDPRYERLEGGDGRTVGFQRASAERTGGADWLRCRDDAWRPVEPGTFPLAYETPARVGRLRGYGNALDVEAATQFIKAYMEALP